MKVSTIGNRIKVALQNKQWLAVDLCNATGISKASMSHYILDQNAPKQPQLYIIAEALGVSEVWLMGYDVPIKKESPSFLSEEEATVLDYYRKLSPKNKELFSSQLKITLKYQGVEK